MDADDSGQVADIQLPQESERNSSCSSTVCVAFPITSTEDDTVVNFNGLGKPMTCKAKIVDCSG